MKTKHRQHKQKVSAVQRQMTAFYKAKQQVRMYHGESNSTRVSDADRQKTVDVSSLTDILEVNSDERYVLVEPNVPLDALIQATIPFGLMPAVVSEFPGITIGGAVQGGAAESSSYAWGCLHEIALEYEVVLGNGAVVTASNKNHPDLYHGLACSYGSLGVLTLIKLQLVDAPKFVELAYVPVKSAAEASRVMTLVAKNKPLFIDAIMFGKEEGVVMIGNKANDLTLPLARFSQARDEWFYLHAQNVASKHSNYKERIPLQDYLFRYDRGAFWMGKHGYKLFHIPFNRFTRYWFSSFMKTRTLYRFLHGAHLSQQFIIQDLCLPKASVQEFVDYVDSRFGIEPLWLCPLKTDKEAWLAPNYLKSESVINVGLWGAFHGDYDAFIDTNREIENKVHSLGGRKVLYAHCYYEEANFWKVYDHERYLAIRKKYKADDSLKNIYDKVTVKKKYKASVIKGWMAILKDAGLQ